ncbi:rhomboid family intramembrane serine protease GlpG [Rheinheimera salexigens]|uniref:Rhomboid family intramembrane serine protease GlpG n=1 Tax=Rheinheimera salexigens TaxID=1628148 RepID=A0A1E7Q475_9GAMM|nr:rhomboid family intramembrane serine protease GlpG [Rheinheimera salexigens]OEY68949.1 rhomboid family intramembrane serine protease GlpG [Rheinheimera salexigens]
MTESYLEVFAVLNSAKAAQLFADYCQAQGIAVHLEIKSTDVAELYCAADQLAQAEAELAQFMQQPQHKRYQQAAWQLSKPSASQTTVLPSINWQRSLLLAPLTTAMLVLCLLVYAWMYFDWPSAAKWLQLSEPAQLWRWFTPMLLHFSLTHLVFNLAWWWLLGRQFERVLGFALLANFTLSVALISNAAQYFMTGPNFGGLSGVVYGLFGYCWLAGLINPRQRMFISSGMAGFLVLWLVLGFFDLLWVNMANWAHLAGLVSGMAWALILRKHPGRH